MMVTLRYVILLAGVLIISGCVGGSSDQVSTSELSGQLLIWHSWQGEERAVLREIIDSFGELYPDVTIVEDFYSSNTLQDTFTYQVAAGLGPDIMIASSDMTEPLASAGFIRNIATEGEAQGLDVDAYLSSAMAMLQTEDARYGLPLSLRTLALYYNPALLNPPAEEGTEATAMASDRQRIAELIQNQQQDIEDPEASAALDDVLTALDTPEDATTQQFVPAGTLDALLEQANLGKSVGIPIDFTNAAWGVGAFGGQLFDEEGRVVLNQGGLTNWLNWLRQAQGNPFVVLNRNRDELAQLFMAGELTYYVGHSDELNTLQAALGEEGVGVVRLPGRENSPARPFLQADVLMFNQVLAPQNVPLAFAFAKYLTNTEQQRKLALSIGKLPANRGVNIDPRISPIVAELIAQSRTSQAIALDDMRKFNDLVALGDDLYNQVIEGESNAGEAVLAMTTQINDQYGFETVAFEQVESCDLTGSITLWNTRPEAIGEALGQVRDNFQALCTDVTVEIRDVDPAEFNDAYLQAIEAGDAPTMFTANNRQLSALVSQEQVFNLSTIIDADFAQRFIPAVAESMAIEGNTYGIPMSLDVLAMYYNTELVEDPPLVLDDLLAAASPERQLALPMGFTESYWGLAAFGETSDTAFFDDEGRLILGEQGLTGWLTWLRDAQSQPGIVLSEDATELQALFEAGTAGFLVSNYRRARELQRAVGSDNVAVVPLPAGRPLLTVYGLMFSPFIDETERAIALAFSQFVTNPESQTILLAEADELPTNINISVADYPLAGVFLEQANTADILPNTPAIDAVFALGDSVYEQVLVNDLNPEDAVMQFTNLVDSTNGFEVVAETATAFEDCTEQGTVSLWHSWTAAESAAWEQVIANFAEVCPDIDIDTTFVAADELTDQLASTLQAESDMAAPDFFLGPQTELENYLDLGLIRSISAFVSADDTINYLPRSVTAFSLADDVYGIPQMTEVVALYYRTDLVEEPARTFQGLLEQAQQGITIGLRTTFLSGFWGAAAFDCLPCQSGQFLNEQGELALSAQDFAGWLAWLNDINDTGNVVFGDSRAELETLFYQGDIAYMVGWPENLNDAQEALGVANVGVLPLPVGVEERRARPFLWVEGFYFYQQASEEQLNLALRFAQFVGAEASQTLLMQEGNYVPINRLAIAQADDPLIQVFIGELEESLLIPRLSVMNQMREAGLMDIFSELTTN